MSFPANENTLDGEDNYRCMQLVKQAQGLSVYTALCQKGRNRNRKVILQKTSKKACKRRFSQLSLHHPCIVSMLSVFTTAGHDIQIMEDCPGGGLQCYLANSRPLHEDELRGLVKSLVDVLVYLRKQGIIHRDICPVNILLTGNMRPKLANFDLAAQIPVEYYPELSEFTNIDYVAPELRSMSDHHHSCDLWSLGAVMARCSHSSVSSFLSFDGKLSSDPPTSAALSDLIRRVTILEADKRLKLQLVLSHPFFAPSLPIMPLERISCTEEIALHEDVVSAKIILPKSCCEKVKKPSLPLRLPLTSIRNAPSQPDELMEQPNFDSFSVNVSTPLKRSTRKSSQTLSMAIEFSDLSLPPRPRMFSSIQPARADIQAPNIPTCTSNRLRLLPPPGAPNITAWTLPSPPVSRCSTSETESSSNDDTNIYIPSYCREKRGEASRAPDHATLACGSHLLSTDLLEPQTRKLVYGQLVILPSKALLIDFRAQERRRGSQGREVLLVTSDGGKVTVYDAPHLSTPCCLVEPSHVYDLVDLPGQYRKQYDDACSILEKMRQKVRSRQKGEGNAAKL